MLLVLINILVLAETSVPSQEFYCYSKYNLMLTSPGKRARLVLVKL